MPDRAWRTTRDLATVLAVLALVQLVLSLVFVGSLAPPMLAAQVALIVVLAALALMAHIQLQAYRDLRA